MTKYYLAMVFAGMLISTLFKDRDKNLQYFGLCIIIICGALGIASSLPW